MAQNTYPVKKLVGVAIVRNESDIIEIFVRYNLNVLDELHIIDNDSKDNTVEIIQSLQKEGLPVFLSHYPKRDHTQEFALNQLLRQLCVRDDIDFFFPLDADELILSQSSDELRSLLKNIPDAHCGRIYCENHVCEATPKANTDVFYQKMGWVREFEPKRPMGERIIIPFDLMRTHQLTAGNHFIKSLQPPHQYAPHIELPLALGHFPIRTKDQLIRKIIMGGLALQLKKNKIPMEGMHWLTLAEQLRNDHFQLTDEKFQYISATYDAPRITEHLSVVNRPIHHFDNVHQRYPSKTTTALVDLYDLTQQLILTQKE